MRFVSGFVLFVIEVRCANQAGLELTAVLLPLSPKFWNVPLHLASKKRFLKKRAKAPSVRAGELVRNGMSQTTRLGRAVLG